VELDADHPDGQSLLLWYPNVPAAGNDYIRRATKNESGAKSALDPHAPVTIRPFVADDPAGRDLSVRSVTTVDPSRSFWDKVVILHGLRRWFERRNQALPNLTNQAKHRSVAAFRPVSEARGRDTS
jgi:hypothetical protein